LTPNSITLNNLERANKSVYGFSGDFGLRHRFQEQTASKSIEIDMEKLHIKFSALNVDFKGPSFDFLGSRKAAHESIKVRFPRKSCHFIVVRQFFVKTVADRHGYAAYLNKH